MSTLKKYLPLIGRFLIGAPFLMSGIGKLTSYAATTGYIASVGLPAAGIGWAIAVLMEVGGGALLVLGYRTRLVAPLMALFTLATAVFFHHNFADQNQMIHFLKNIMLAGGLLNIAYFGAGPASLDSASGRQAATPHGQQA
ncbi:putative membrane protein [Herbaspirillum sp. CF444]|uniref:DoxX family protein n=1 Tax=Herbaspirillum sp. CF444 TaxID=1144319 RepID=UPI0002724B55|nr:DoxX family protein [Herbaspirillum sp. CF444]EJL94352.1 putative membrane protein [Herbaspirillum sp. CF444]